MLIERSHYNMPSREDRILRDTEQIASVDRRLADVESRLNSRIQEVKDDLEKDIQEVKGNHNLLVSRLLKGIGIFFTSAVAIIAALIASGIIKIT